MHTLQFGYSVNKLYKGYSLKKPGIGSVFVVFGAFVKHTDIASIILSTQEAEDPIVRMLIKHLNAIL